MNWFSVLTSSSPFLSTLHRCGASRCLSPLSISWAWRSQQQRRRRHFPYPPPPGSGETTLPLSRGFAACFFITGISCQFHCLESSKCQLALHLNLLLIVSKISATPLIYVYVQSFKCLSY